MGHIERVDDIGGGGGRGVGGSKFFSWDPFTQFNYNLRPPILPI